MYKWKIDIILKSGKELTVYYAGEEDNSNGVANKVLKSTTANTFNGFSNEDNTANILVCVGEIATISISVA